MRSGVGRPLSVLKFGSSVLAGPDGFRAAAAATHEAVEAGRVVVAVVSAARGRTDALLRAGVALNTRPPDVLLGLLLSTGETASTALLALALEARGVGAHVVSPAELGLRTRGPLPDARPVEVDAAAVRTLLSAHPAVVAPGFLGVDASGHLSLLGRGGSDLTALFLAHRLGAEECVLVKDVEGVYPHDPATDGRAASPYPSATYDELLAVGGRIVQEKAVRFAREHAVRFRVAPLGGPGTLVGAAGEPAR